MTSGPMPQRAAWFHYAGLEVKEDRLIGHYDLDGAYFTEVVTFEGVADLRQPSSAALAELWYLAAGLSYYKAGAPRRIDLGTTPMGPAVRTWFEALVLDGLGEFAYRNALDLRDVTLHGGHDDDVAVSIPSSSSPRLLTPFGGGIDSVVAQHMIDPELDQALFVVSPPSGRFAPLEATAQVTGRTVLRATRQLDPAILQRDPARFNGHVPVTAMITLLAAVAAAASARHGVVMANEHSASVPNLRDAGRDINHQWSKSHVAEVLMADAVAEKVTGLVVASVLRDRSELWVAQYFAALRDFHGVFRSCNRAFAQDRSQRAANWCGECDKCLFIHLVLAPFIDRARLRDELGVEPLSDPARTAQLRVLVGLGETKKPFECVGDPTECSVALRELANRPEWSDVEAIGQLAPLCDRDVSLEDLLQPQGERRAPASWFR